MNGTELTDRQLELLKRSTDYAEYDGDNHEIIVTGTDYGTTIYQRFSITPTIKEDIHGNPLLDVKVDEDGWATTADGESAGKASYEAYEEARKYAAKNTRAIFNGCETMHEHRSSDE